MTMSIAKSLPPNETREMTWNGENQTFVLEPALSTDFALVRGWKGLALAPEQAADERIEHRTVQPGPTR